MARAKHTERADARRRYRATHADAAAATDAIGTTAVTAASAAASTSGSSKSTRPGPAPSTQHRPPGFTAAFRAAARPLNVREDLRYLPQLIRHRAVWIPFLATLASGVALAAFGSSNSLVNLAAQILVVPPPMAASFLAGLLAPRASYLAGGIAGLWAALVFTAVVFAIPASTAIPVTTDDRVSVALYGLVVSPLFGLAVGGFAGYYRRFLAVSSPNRRRQEEQARAAKQRQAAKGRR